jgi:hypothetical protein
MNQKNFDYLKDGLKYLGFGEGLNNKLAVELASGKPEFQLNTVNEYGRDKVNYKLDFRKSDQSDMYFFNRYNATFKPEGVSPEKAQTFYIKKNSGITAKEAYNLLNGRSVNKDLTNAERQPYNAWLQIDFAQKDDKGNHKFKMIHQAYGYDLDKELSRHPIKELNEPISKERLMQSLERGNLHQVTFVKADKEEKMFIEANPQFKTLNIFDGRLKKVFIEQNNQLHVPVQSEIKNQSTQKESEEQRKKHEKKKGVRPKPDEFSPKQGKGHSLKRINGVH